jgi:hypothetical protein
MATRKADAFEIDIQPVDRGDIEFYIVGESPLICNSMSAKAARELLYPSPRKTAADKATTLKHDPMAEFNDSIYRDPKEDGETLIVMKSTSFKKAMMGAALDIPGAKKAQIGRLLYIVGDYVPIWGTPEIMMSITRSADMNKTPDVRTRAIIPSWTTRFVVQYTQPMLKGPVISKLLGAAGMMQGVGDWRVEKGSGNYGRFRVTEPTDTQYKFIVEAAGRKAQEEAMANPSPYDSETEQLLRWYESELFRRGVRKEEKAA